MTSPSPLFLNLNLGKKSGKYKLLPSTAELTFTPRFVQQIHTTLGTPRTFFSCPLFLKRNLKVRIKQAINSCEQCKGTHTFKSLTPPSLTKAFVPNQVLQIDFIGPLHAPFADNYALLLTQQLEHFMLTPQDIQMQKPLFKHSQHSSHSTVHRKSLNQTKAHTSQHHQSNNKHKT